ncbi:SH3 domain-containing protein [Flavobacteriaceae sp. LMIT009]
MYYKAFILMCLFMGYAQAQDIQYVNAENGLAVRENPNRGSTRLGLLDYGTVLEIIEHTNLQLDVMDNGQKLSGEWVKVRSIDAYDTFEGYVFNGFLTEEKLEKRFKATYDEFTVHIEGITEKKAKTDKINPEFDGVIFYTFKEGESLDGKTIRVKHHQDFRSIQVFQKHENSLVINDDKSHCDMINWQHYYSSWKPLRTISSNHQFKGLAISEKEASRFIEVDLEEFKHVVNEDCGEAWSESVKDVQSVTDDPVSIKTTKEYLRVVMTDIDGNKIEKVIIFEVPLKSLKEKDLYAKL